MEMNISQYQIQDNIINVTELNNEILDLELTDV